MNNIDENLNTDNASAALALLDALYDEDLHVQYEHRLSASNTPDKKALGSKMCAYSNGLVLATYARRGMDDRARDIANQLAGDLVSVMVDDQKTVGGWNFSRNVHSPPADGSSFLDPRLITGANAWVLYGLVHYMISSGFRNQSTAHQFAIRGLLQRALKGISDHVRKDHLVSAGWTTKTLQQAEGTAAYYDILENCRLGDDFAYVRSTNVATEHCVDLMGICHLAAKHSQTLGIAHPKPWTTLADKIRNAVYNQLFDNDGRIYTGLVQTPHEQRSPHSAVDNASWLSWWIDYSALSDAQADRLGRALQHCVRGFVSPKEHCRETYLGANYFNRDFADNYITPNELHEQIYHLEATAGVIAALRRFSTKRPDSSFAAEFRHTADRLWRDMNRFVADHGFVYATHEIPGCMDTHETTTSACWYLMIYDGLDAADCS